VGCANYDIRASRAQMMMINKGMNGVSIRIRCARIESLSRASRTAVGPVPSFAVWRVASGAAIVVRLRESACYVRG
jgi:hypothetical protein